MVDFSQVIFSANPRQCSRQPLHVSLNHLPGALSICALKQGCFGDGLELPVRSHSFIWRIVADSESLLYLDYWDGMLNTHAHSTHTRFAIVNLQMSVRDITLTAFEECCFIDAFQSKLWAKLHVHRPLNLSAISCSFTQWVFPPASQEMSNRQMR